MTDNNQPSTDLIKELAAIQKKENRILASSPKQNRLKSAIYVKVPQNLRTALETAFSKAFRLVFLKGTHFIEKTFDKENACLEYEAGNYIVDKTGSKKSIQILDKNARNSSLLNNTVTIASGFGLGLLGFGLPDIPLMTGTLLKGIYEIAMGYGFSYDSEEERIYILRLIRTALADGEIRQKCNCELDGMSYSPGSLEEEISTTSKILSDALLVEKFIQGIPVAGAVGGIVNHSVYRKISVLAAVKYKKRYLQQKLSDYGDQP